MARNGQNRKAVTGDDTLDRPSPEMTARLTLADLGINPRHRRSLREATSPLGPVAVPASRRSASRRSAWRGSSCGGWNSAIVSREARTCQDSRGVEGLMAFSTNGRKLASRPRARALGSAGPGSASRRSPGSGAQPGRRPRCDGSRRRSGVRGFRRIRRRGATRNAQPSGPTSAGDHGHDPITLVC